MTSTTRFRVARPRLAIAGLNPHAGENGALGEEDRTIVARRGSAHCRRHRCAGPAAGDSLFHEAARAATTSLVHVSRPGADPDQTLAFDHAVNVTLGLPFVRTSPDHVPHYIAGTGKRGRDEFGVRVQLAARLAMADDPDPCRAS